MANRMKVQVEANVQWKSIRTADGAHWVATCDPLSLTVQSESFAELMEDIALTLDAMLRDLLSTNELDAFLKNNGWQLLSQNVALASQAEDVRFDVPFGVITEQSGRNAPTVLH